MQNDIANVETLFLSLQGVLEAESLFSFFTSINILLCSLQENVSKSRLRDYTVKRLHYRAKKKGYNRLSKRGQESKFCIHLTIKEEQKKFETYK
jgi:hypothetical protein